MKKPPQLSVIMPVRNAAETVAEAVESVLASTFQDFEFIIIDDASTDDSEDLIRSTADERIRVFSNPSPGLCSALNLAVSHCRAPYIARMDADDWCYPDRFSHQLEAITQRGWDIVGGLVRIVDRQRNGVPSLHRYEEWINQHHENESIRAYRFVESPLANPTTLARREVYQVPFDEGPFPEDYEFWLQAMHRGFTCGKISETVLDWIDSPTRTTRNDARYSPEAFDRCRQKYLQLGPLAAQTIVHHWGAGQTGKPWLRWLLEIGYEVPFVVDVAPKKIGQNIHKVPVIAPHELPPPSAHPLLVAVGAASAREEIARFVMDRGYTIGKDVWFVA